MKHTKAILSVLISLLLVSSAIAQTSEPQTASGRGGADAIAAAHSRYTQNESVSQSAKDSSAGNSDTPDADTLAQFSRRGPTRPYPYPFPRRGYPRGGSPYMWQQPFNGHHALIGAVIGFGLGAAIGVKANTDQHPQARIAAPLIFGSIGALLGATIGGTLPPSPWARLRRGHGLPHEGEREEDQVAGRPNPPRTTQRASLPPPGPCQSPAEQSEACPVSSVKPEVGGD